MARIPETAVKWINDKLKTKPQKSNYVGAVKVSDFDTDIKQCHYCHKMFLNSSFAVKHTLKRHPDQLLLLHKKAIDSTKTDVDNSQIDLVNYLKNEFANLKTEIEVVKKVVAHHSSAGNCYPATYQIGVQECKGAGDCNDMNIVSSLGEQSLQTKQDNSICRDDFIKLQGKVEEIFQMYKKISLVKENKTPSFNEDKLYKRLKKELLSEFEHMFIRYQRNNSYDERFSRLTKDLQSLEEAVENNSKMIKSPEALQEIDRKIEQQIETFYANYGVLDTKRKMPAKRNKRVLSDNSNVHRLNRRKKNIYTCNSQGLVCQREHHNIHLKSNNSSAGSSKTSRDACSPSTLKDHTKNIQKLGIDNAKVLFDEKLKDLNVSPNAKQMSAEEYETKMHLLIAQKELLCQKYPNFKQMYEKIDSQANKLVKSKMRTPKQIRFSELPAVQSSSKTKLLLEAASPVAQKDDQNQLELKYDFCAASDCDEAKTNCDDRAIVMSIAKSDYASNMSSEKGHTKNSELQNKALSAHKTFGMSDKSLSPIPSVEEFSELSSLDSDSNFS